MNSIERFKKKKAILQKIEQRNGLSLVGDQNLVNNLLTSEVDLNAIQASNDRLNEQYDFNPDIKVTYQEVDDLLLIMKNDFDGQRFNDLVSACKKDVISAIVNPFGLGMLVARLDKNGGNVTTIHNFEQGITATAEDKQRYNEWQNAVNSTINREPYDFDIKKDKNGNSIKNKNGENVKTSFNTSKKKEIFNKLDHGDTVNSGYTGEILGKKSNGNIDKNQQIDLEHITSVEKIERNLKNHLFSKGDNSESRQNYRVNLARDENNLTLVEGNLNKSKNCHDLKEWANDKNRTDPSKTNSEFYKTNQELINKEYEKSKKFLEKEALHNQLKKQGKETAITSATEGVKMGVQQAVGLVIYEFFDAIFDELEDIYQNGFSSNCVDDRFIHVVKERFSRIAIRIASRWKDVGTAFADGFISGLLSNLVTVVINMFVRTGKRMVRMIREGFFSLLRAIKMLCFPPQGMTSAQAAHEASKLIATGLVVIGGIAIEQHIDTMIKAAPMLEPLADILTSILIGGLTGVAVTLIVYAIDKIDFFQVNEHDKHTFIMHKLENSLSVMFTESDLIIADMKI